jgi:hypothetical protein
LLSQLGKLDIHTRHSQPPSLLLLLLKDWEVPLAREQSDYLGLQQSQQWPEDTEDRAF